MINEYIKKIIFILLLGLLVYVIILVFPTILAILKSIFNIILPVLIAFSLAFIINPLVNKVQKKIKSRLFSIIIILIILLIIIISILVFTIPTIKDEYHEFKKTIPILVENIKNILDKITTSIQNISGESRIIDNIDIETKLTNLFNKLFLFGDKISSNILYYLSILVVVPILTVYFLIDYYNITSYLKKILIKNNKTNFLNYLLDLSHTMNNYIKGIIIVMFILFILFSIAFTLLGIPYGIIFALFIALTNVIPYVGAYIGGLLPFMFALSVSYSKAIFTVIVCIIIQTIESNIITPMIQSKYVKLNPIFVVLALLVFGKVFGFFGMILSLPILTFIKITLKHYPIKALSLKDK